MSLKEVMTQRSELFPEIASQLAAQAAVLDPRDRHTEERREVVIGSILTQKRSWPEAAAQRLKIIQKELGHCGVTIDMFPLADEEVA
jgi:endonuclease III-like uncharacterized protein